MIILKIYDSSEEQVLSDALYELRERKQEAHKVVAEHQPEAGFTERDFGIPQITKLIERLEAAEDIE